VDVLDELGDLQRAGVVAQCDCVGSQAGEFFDRVRQCEEVVFNGDVEGIFVFDIDGDCEARRLALASVLLALAFWP
jgi:hypothetical protein